MRLRSFLKRPNQAIFSESRKMMLLRNDARYVMPPSLLVDNDRLHKTCPKKDIKAKRVKTVIKEKVIYIKNDYNIQSFLSACS